MILDRIDFLKAIVINGKDSIYQAVVFPQLIEDE